MFGSFHQHSNITTHWVKDARCSRTLGLAVAIFLVVEGSAFAFTILVGSSGNGIEA
jgi:hypothetical protein